MSAAMQADVSTIPVEISRANQHDVKIQWKDGHVSVYPSRELRLKCACAACVHEMTGEMLLDPNHIASDVRPLRIEAVGRYAIQIVWSDGHSTGIYTFEHLRRMCPCTSCAPSAL